MNSGDHSPQKDSGEPFSWKLRPTLQLKIVANSWNKFRPTSPPEKIQVNPSAGFYGQLFSWILRPPLGMSSGDHPQKDSGEALQLNFKANSSAEK